MVTPLLEQALSEAARLSPEEQDELAQWILEEISERGWKKRFAESGDLLDKLADEALREHWATKQMKRIEEGYGFLPGIDSTVEREDDRDILPSSVPPLTSDLPKRSRVKLPPKAKEKFDLFVTCANKQILHHLDWERFYFFIWHCASHNVRISGQQVEDLLVDADFTEDYAEHIALIFVHGIDMIKGPQR